MKFSGVLQEGPFYHEVEEVEIGVQTESEELLN